MYDNCTWQRYFFLDRGEGSPIGCRSKCDRFCRYCVIMVGEGRE
jgi:hypothetical protein